jgi:hypothetical protein
MLKFLLPAPLITVIAFALSAGAQTGPKPETNIQTVPKPITTGPVVLNVKKINDLSISSLLELNVSFFSGLVNIRVGAPSETSQSVKIENNSTLPEVADQINSNVKGVAAELATDRSGSRLVVKSTDREDVTVTDVPFATQPVAQIQGSSTQSQSTQQSGATKPIFTRSTPSYIISLAPDSKTALELVNKDGQNQHRPEVHILIHAASGALVDLAKQDWYLQGTDKAIGFLTIGDEKSEICTRIWSDGKSQDVTIQMISERNCHLEFVLSRRLQLEDVVKAVEVSNTGVEVSPEITQDSKQIVFVNGARLVNESQVTMFDNTSGARFAIFRVRPGCREYSGKDADWSEIRLYPPPVKPPGGVVDNGITVGTAKIFDVVLLRKMLNDTSGQLAALSGFNAASITGAIGNLQGVTRDTSFLSAQVTTVPLPTLSSTQSAGNTGTNSTTITAPVAGSSPSTVTLQCPAGTLPTIATNGAQACTPDPSGSSIPSSSSTLTTTPSSTSQQVSGATTTNQSSNVTTSGGYAATVPVAYTSTPLTNPTNVGVASSDILAEQVQLNAQLTTLRLLLQGASSDQYLVSNSRAVATRQQTTLGFAVTLDPPRQYRHAVAEIRIMVVPPAGRDGVSIMTLLPTEKTYNVAKITSKQNSFGGGATVEAVNVGVNTGRSKDRLYLAKDTDTVALEYREPSVASVKPPVPQRAHDSLKGAVDFEPLGPCDALNPEPKGAKVFGWQFRPVLGAEYVRGGQRQVFAQLALPASLNEEYVPTVYVQTRWRAYDPKRQVVGAIYKDSCDIVVDSSGIALLSPLRVRDLAVTDIGGGQIKLTAQGDFLAPGVIVRSGPNNVLPTVFDGTNIEVFGNVHDVLQAGDLSMVGENGVKTPFAIASKRNQSCGIARADFDAMPSPDGNSRVKLHLTLGADYDLLDENDGVPQPLVLVGSQVYGLQETPYLDWSTPNCRPQGQGHAAECTYYFVAPTATLRNAQTFLVKDVTWDNFKKKGTIQFAPSFNGLSVSSVLPDATAPADSARDKMVFAVSGYDLRKLNASQASPYRLTLLVGDATPPDLRFSGETDNEGTLSALASSLGKAKTVRFEVLDATDVLRAPVFWDLSIPKSDAQALTASPGFLHRGDSAKVTFSGGDLANASALVGPVTFEDATKLTATFELATKSISVVVPTAVSKLAGKKEFSATVILDKRDGKGPVQKTIQLPIDIIKQ